jgi:hypothetical protein
MKKERVRKLGKFLLNLIHEYSSKSVMIYIAAKKKEEHEGVPCRGTGAGGTSGFIPIIHHDELFDVVIHS